MNKAIEKQQRRATRIRSKVRGTEERPRLTLSRSNAGMYAQVINDTMGKTLLGMSLKSLEKVTGSPTVDSASKGKSSGAESKSSGSMTKSEKAKALGIAFAQEAKKHKISKVVFDKGAYQYHGRVKAFADGAREGGLDF